LIVRAQERRQLSCASLSELDDHENAHDRHKKASRETARREDVAPGQSRADHTGLIAGVLVSRPNFNALCGRTKL
jgi:hypothetical protein